MPTEVRALVHESEFLVLNSSRHDVQASCYFRQIDIRTHLHVRVRTCASVHRAHITVLSRAKLNYKSHIWAGKLPVRMSIVSGEVSQFNSYSQSVIPGRS